jgi:actin-related protein
MKKANKLITPFSEIKLIENEESNTDSDFDNDQEIKKDPSEFYSNYSIQKGDMSNYNVHTKIGRGRYSEVFEGYNIKTEEPVVIKILKPSNNYSFYITPFIFYSKKT